MTRRSFLATGAAFGALAAFAPSLRAAEGTFPLSRTEDEWRALLTDAEFDVMRREATERPFTSPLNDITAEGMFRCKGCDQALYPSDTKYKSGTGWPSFWAAASEDAIGTKPDRKLFIVRTECHCSNCGSHLGHIFDDGPEPTGKRHCINGVAMFFEPADGGEIVVG